MNPNREQFTKLASHFPSLRDAEGINPWNPNQLDIWAAQVLQDENAIHAARLLLSLWNPDNDWECGQWNEGLALNRWDYTHYRAYMDVSTACPQIIG